MAFGLLRKFLEEEGVTEVEVRTAGVMTIPGLLPTQECRQILAKDGIDVVSHRSCKMTPELLRRATLILGMTSFHVQMALRMSEEARGKTYLLKEYVGLDTKNSQIQDPMGCTLEVYKKVYREIRRACKRLVKMELRKPGPPASQLRGRAAALFDDEEPTAGRRGRGRKPAPAVEEEADVNTDALRKAEKAPAAKREKVSAAKPEKPAKAAGKPAKTAAKPAPKAPAAAKAAPSKRSAEKAGNGHSSPAKAATSKPASPKKVPAKAAATKKGGKKK